MAQASKESNKDNIMTCENGTANRTEAQTSQARQKPTIPETLIAGHMPTDYSISLDSYKRGGTDHFLSGASDGKARQPMKGFEPQYVDIIDYIVRVTHHIWEEKDIGYIYDTYSHDCKVWDDLGLQYGRDKIVADTVHTNNAFPDIRLVADEVIWAGDEKAGFHTSHRARVLGTNTGFSRFGAPTGRPVQLWCIANCVSRDNEIFQEHVLYDTGGMLQQLGIDVRETARRLAAESQPQLMPSNFLASEPRGLQGQGKPTRPQISTVPRDNIRPFVEAAYQTIWNGRNFGAIDSVYASNVLVQGSAGRVYRGTGQLRSFIMSIVTMFPNISLVLDDVYWMGNPSDGYLVSIRWSAMGTHNGNGPYGSPTGKEVSLWGISQWHLKGGLVQQEWLMFNEFGVLQQIYRQ